MNIEELRSYCLSVKGATESFPFDKTTLVGDAPNSLIKELIIHSAEEVINCRRRNKQNIKN